MSKDEFAQRAIALRERQYRIAWAILKHEADCLDAMQEALAKAWASRQSLRNEAFFSTWLIRILINECNAILRKRRRVIPVAEFPADACVNDSVPEIQQLVDALPDSLRLPFVLYYMEGYAMKEIAKMLRTTTSAVKNRVFRARNTLRMALEPERKPNKETEVRAQ